MTELGRLDASHKGDEDVSTWHLPDGTRLHLLTRTRRGSTFSSPRIFARLCNDNFDTIETFDGRVDGLNAWLTKWSIGLI